MHSFAIPITLPIEKRSKWRHAIHLHGRIHAKPEYSLRSRGVGIFCYDVGVDANNYCPVSRDEILDFFRGVEPAVLGFAQDEMGADA